METRNSPKKRARVPCIREVPGTPLSYYIVRGPFTDDLPSSDGSGGDETRVRSPGETFPAAPALSRGT